MKLPKMILFDYGDTLIYEPSHDYLRGQRAVCDYIKNNKNNLTPEQINDFSEALYQKLSIVRDIGIEMHEWHFERFLYDYLEIELSISMKEAEKIFWYNASPELPMPNIVKLLDYINERDIISGVISNIGFSGGTLSERINEILPRNKFKFIIASSEYMYRKPNPMLFELALKKAGIDAENTWFCGDSLRADIIGANSAGMFPVWYDNQSIENPWRIQNNDVDPGCEYLHIQDWNELIEILEGLS